MDERFMAAIRAGLQMVGLLLVLSILAGAVKIKPIDFNTFASGGLWLGLPAVFATYVYMARHDR